MSLGHRSVEGTQVKVKQVISCVTLHFIEPYVPTVSQESRMQTNWVPVQEGYILLQPPVLPLSLPDPLFPIVLCLSVQNH